MTKEIEKSMFILTLMGTTGKLGSQYICLNVEELWSYLEQVQLPKNCQRMYAALTMEKNTSSSTFLDLVSSHRSYTRHSKNSKMDLCTIIDTTDNVEIFVALNSSSLPIQS